MVKKMGPRALTFVISEAEANLSRDEGELALNQVVTPGQILAIIAGEAGVVVTSAARAGNTSGAGALTLANPAYTSKAKPGVYTVVCIEPATNGGSFRVEDPNGKEIGTAVVGVAFTKEVKFTIADATDFVAGDAFEISVDFGADDDAGEQYVAFDPTATDGSEIAAAFSCYGAVTSDSETQRIVVIDQLAVINSQDIPWPDGITDAQKHKAERDLKKRFIKLQ